MWSTFFQFFQYKHLMNSKAKEYEMANVPKLIPTEASY